MSILPKNSQIFIHGAVFHKLEYAFGKRIEELTDKTQRYLTKTFPGFEASIDEDRDMVISSTPDKVSRIFVTRDKVSFIHLFSGEPSDLSESPQMTQYVRILDGLITIRQAAKLYSYRLVVSLDIPLETEKAANTLMDTYFATLTHLVPDSNSIKQFDEARFSVQFEKAEGQFHTVFIRSQAANEINIAHERHVMCDKFKGTFEDFAKKMNYRGYLEKEFEPLVAPVLRML